MATWTPSLDVEPSRGRRALVTLLALVIGLVVALVAGEAIVRTAGGILHRIPIVKGDPRLGWAGWPRMDRAAKTYSGGTFRMSTDSLGRRRTYPASRPPLRNAPVILLVGDSFIQGIGAEDEETVAWLLARALRDRNVINLGVAGYGTDQELLATEEFFRAGGKAVSDIVVVAFENDFSDVENSFDYALARSKPTVGLRGLTIERRRYRLSLLDRVMDRSRLVWLARTQLMYRLRPLPIPTASGVDIVVACLDEIRRVGRQHDARVHLFAYRPIERPVGRDERVSDALWAGFIARSGAIDLTGAVRVGEGPSPIGFDRLHWSAEGNRRATEAILEHAQVSQP